MDEALPTDAIAPQKPAFPESVTKEEINRLRLFRYDGAIHLIRHDDDCARSVQALRKYRILGFDTETRPSFRKGQSYLPSLLQLAGDHEVHVFQLPKLTQLGRLFRLLADPAILKVGVATDHDVRQLRSLHDFEPSGFVNLEEMTDQVGIRNNGLRSLCAIVLGVRISKGEQRSNWSRDPLTEKQVRYAATDAWVSREIYLKLETLRHPADLA